MLLSFVFTFLMIISFFLLCDGSGRERQVCEKEDIEDIVRSCCGGKVCLKKRIAKKNINNLRDQLDQLKMDIKSLGRQHKEDLKKILSALLRLEEKKGSHEETTKKHSKTTTTKASKPRIVRSCADAMGDSLMNGIYRIRIPKYSDQPFEVSCEADPHGGKGWTVFMRRMDGSIDFYRFWDNYKVGFGHLKGEFFIGLDKLHAITYDQPHELLVVLEDWEGDIRYRNYDQFVIGSELDKYRLEKLGYSHGTVGDALEQHRGKYFTTRDRDNDEWRWNCAQNYTGAWWYAGCFHSNLMGRYRCTNFGQGIIWYTFRNYYYSLKRAVMMLRPIELGTTQ